MNKVAIYVIRNEGRMILTRKPPTSVLINSSPANSPEYAWLTFTAYSNETADSPGGEDFTDSLIGSGVIPRQLFCVATTPSLLVWSGPLTLAHQQINQFPLGVTFVATATSMPLVFIVPQYHLRFGEDGTRALLQACANTERSKNEWQGEGDWDLYISQQERQGRGDEEGLRVRDSLRRKEPSKFSRTVWQFYEQAEAEDNMLESITVRPMRPDGSVLDGMAYRWTLSTPRLARRKVQEWRRSRRRRIPGQKMKEKEKKYQAREEASARRGLTLGELDREYGKGLETARVRTFEEVRGNVFGTTSLGEGEPEEDATIEDSPPNPMRRMLGLKSSRHAVIDLMEEEGRKKEYKEKGDDWEEENREASTGASPVGNSPAGNSPVGNRSWKPIWEFREAMTIVYSIKTNREVLEEIEALRLKERS
ncbi:hypothetical protein BGX38DRAFT_1260279 [Terfezia claveryi]|nr:hypothetical protein BGX38DRAFT_1260279 [Terfezia claveryi]